MRKIYYFTSFLLISATVDIALAMQGDVLVGPNLISEPTKLIPHSIGSVTVNDQSNVVTIHETKKLTIPYKVYVSAVIDKNIITSNSDGKEIFKMLKDEHQGEVAKFITPEICAPHVTLFQGEVELTGPNDTEPNASDILTDQITQILEKYKGRTFTVNDSEVGGMHAGGTNSYFIAYNVNDKTSKLQKMARLVKDKVGVSPKTYGDYSTRMDTHGFKGVFSKHLDFTNDSLLHISILRAFTTKKVHPLYGKSLSYANDLVSLYNNLNSHLSKTFDRKKTDKSEAFTLTSIQKDAIIQCALDNYGTDNALLGTGTTSPLNGLVFNSGKDLKILEKIINNSLDGFYGKTLKELTSEEKKQATAFFKDIIAEPKPEKDNPNKFISKGRNGYEMVPNLQAILLKSEGDYAVGPTNAGSENITADQLCSTLQKTDIGALTLKINSFQISVSPKKPD